MTQRTKPAVIGIFPLPWETRNLDMYRIVTQGHLPQEILHAFLIGMKWETANTAPSRLCQQCCQQCSLAPWLDVWRRSADVPGCPRPPKNTEKLQLGAFWTPGLGVPGTPSMGALEALGWHARNSAESSTPGLKRAL